MNHVDTQYLKIAKDILEHGDAKVDRTGTGTISTFGQNMRFDLSEGFPLLTTKHVPFRLVAEELFWFLSGDANNNTLTKKNVHIWDEWADENGDLGRIYGKQWREFRGWRIKDGKDVETFAIDQINQLMHNLEHNPHSRRHIIVAYNPADVDCCSLPACHSFFQFYVSADNKLSCQYYMRSNDWFLGSPFNIASYALLTHLIAETLGYQVGELLYVGGDVHIYQNHLEQMKLQISREKLEAKALPQLKIKRKNSIFDYTIDDVELVGYNPYPSIKADVSV